MVRGKVQLKKIENTVHRQVTFCKRRAGLLKKAKELSILCDADVGIIIFSAQGKLYELATKGTMEELIERYKMASAEAQSMLNDASQYQESEQEMTILKQEIDLLNKGLRHMLGYGNAGHMALDELHALEKHLEIWMYHIRTAKMKIMFQEIQSLKNKEGILKAANEFLRGKILDQQSGIFGIGPMIVQQNGHFEVASSVTTDTPYSLTLQNEYSDFRGSDHMSFSY